MDVILESVKEAAQALALNGIYIVGVVLVLVEFLKQFENKEGKQWLQGNWLLLVGFGIGALFAMLTYVANTVPPTGTVGGDPAWHVMLGYWFLGAIYGVLVGVLPSGTYQLLFKKQKEEQAQ